MASNCSGVISARASTVVIPAAASFSKAPAYFDPLNLLELALADPDADIGAWRDIAHDLLAQTADLPPGPDQQPIVPPSLLTSPRISALVKGLPTQACLPTGRYSINVVYPDGQAWTVPNEAGACANAEGATNYAKLTCTIQPRPVLRSQGDRAVVEITPAAKGACRTPLPPACLPTP